jgi:hypothetical protein
MEKYLEQQRIAELQRSMAISMQTKNITYNRQSDNDESDVGDESQASRGRNTTR